MKPSTKDQTKGKMHEVKGTVKEGAGKATPNVSMEQQGRAEKITGKVQKNAGKVEKKLEK